jgi:hypothetical protein
MPQRNPLRWADRLRGGFGVHRDFAHLDAGFCLAPKAGATPARASRARIRSAAARENPLRNFLRKAEFYAI